MAVDIVGSGDKAVAVVELDEKSKKSIEEVAEEIMKNNKNVKTVLEKIPGTKGKYRMKETKVVKGDDNTEVVHKEHGYTLKLDPRKVYFSPRESTIREYVSMQASSGEKILVMMAGVGPYAVCISKIHPDVKEIVAVEINPDGIHYMKENVRMNKIAHMVTPVEGDVSEACKDYDGEFDRVIMPMKDAKDFLPLASKCVKKGGMIHVYMISEEENLYKDAEKFVSDTFKKLNVQYEIKGEVKIALYAPRKWKVLIEIMKK